MAHLFWWIDLLERDQASIARFFSFKLQEIAITHLPPFVIMVTTFLKCHNSHVDKIYLKPKLLCILVYDGEMFRKNIVINHFEFDDRFEHVTIFLSHCFGCVRCVFKSRWLLWLSNQTLGLYSCAVGWAAFNQLWLTSWLFWPP